MTSRNLITFVLLFVFLALPSIAFAEWSSDASLNLAIADRTGDQAQAKVQATTLGGCYISWFDNNAGGYDVYLQLLNALGNETWAHNGVLVADRSFSSTQDYGIGIDTTGAALLAFRDDRSGSDQITAARINSSGTLLWGSSGVQLTSGIAFFASPKIAGTSDGGIVVGWISDSDVGLQKLDANGSPLWGSGITLSDATDGSYALCDIKASDSGSVIVSWVRQGPNFWDPKHIWAQKFSSAGTALWTSPAVVVFDGGSLQFGNYPTFITDGSGGAVFSWYDVSPLQCFAQRILANGNEKFIHNGTAVSTSTRDRVSPSASFNPVTEEVFVFWREQFSGQDGVYGQKLSSTGARQWGSQGIPFAPLSTTEKTQVRSLQYGTGAMFFFVEALSFGDDRLYGGRIDSDGNFIWSPSILTISSVASDKSRLYAEVSSSDNALLAWSDDRSGNDDIYGQNVKPDGTLGPSDDPIPTLSEWGLAGMILLLAALGILILGRRGQVQG